MDKIQSRHWQEDGADSTVNWALEDYVSAWAEAHKDRAVLLVRIRKLEAEVDRQKRRVTETRQAMTGNVHAAWAAAEAKLSAVAGLPRYKVWSNGSYFGTFRILKSDNGDMIRADELDAAMSGATAEALPEKWRSENGDYPESKRDCADELEIAVKAYRARLRKLPDKWIEICGHDKYDVADWLRDELEAVLK